MTQHTSTAIPRTHPFSPEQLAEAWHAFQRLPKPVLVHCSAGVDRTGRVVAHILGHLHEQGPEGHQTADGRR